MSQWNATSYEEGEITHVWRGRENRSWRGEAASGLRFDDTTPKPPAV